MSKEMWKDVGDIDGFSTFSNFQVSNKGRIKNKKTGNIRKILIDDVGYPTVSIHNETGEHRRVRVHRLVALAFLKKAHDKDCVNHIDGDKENNDVSNLEWVTYSENIRHAYKNKLNPYTIPIIIEETGEMFDSIEDCAIAIEGDSELIRQCLNPKYNRKTHKGYHFIPVDDYTTGRKALKIKILETGETFNSVRECERVIDGSHTNISKAAKSGESYKDLHFEFIYDENKKKEKKPFLYPHQKEAINNMFNGCVLNGTVGSGKSRTGLYYYFSINGGSIDPDYIRMRNNPPDLYIITTAKKRNDMEWEQELIPFLLSTDEKANSHYGNKVVVDSWQNIKKYEDVNDAFFIFDENKINGKGTWAKSFLKITKNNEWIILSASNGDRWEDFETLFIAEGFFKNRTEFRREHLMYSNYTNFPKVTGYRNEERLLMLREKILIDMDFNRKTVPHHEDVYVRYDIAKYKHVIRNRWDIYKDEPITQASGLCYVLRRIVNEDVSRQVALLEILEDHPKAIIFYNFDNELDILLNLGYPEGTEIAQYNGHKHEPIPKGDKWVYLVNYNACEAWNTTLTNCMIFFSQNYSYKVMTQAAGRIDRLVTPYTDLYYYHLKSRSGIDLAISKALANKKKFNERKWTKWDK